MDLYNLVLSAKITKGEGGGGGDEPTGTKEISITQNGVTIEDVKSYASAKITTSVPVGVFPSGTKQISSNGNFDVTNFASAAVNISPIIQSLSISENGTYSVPSGVDGYNPITVNVSGGGGGGDHDAEDGLVTRAISGVYENSRVTKIGGSAFYGCTSLTAVSFLNVTSIGGSAFYNCKSLTTVRFLNAASIGGNAFNGCLSLKSFYVLASSVATLAGTNAFLNTPISKSSYLGYFGSIYVPASLVDSYKSAANWSAYSDRITAYEG